MRLLVFRFSSLGDVALCLPVLRSVLHAHPELEITFVTRKAFAPLFIHLPRTQLHFLDANGTHKGFPGLFRLYRELRSLGHFDAVIDLHNVLRSQVVRSFFRWTGTDVYAYRKDRKGRKALTRAEGKERKPLTHTAEHYLAVFAQAGFKAELLSAPHIGGSYQPEKACIGFAPLASNRQKTWPLHHARKLLELLHKQVKRVVLFGGPGEREILLKLADGLDYVEVLAGKSKGLLDEIHQMQSLEYMISMDSANMHLAALAGLPTISIWGATHPDAGFAALGKRHQQVQIAVEDLPCRPCSVFGQKSCARGDWACMEQLQPQMVLEAIANAYS